MGLDSASGYVSKKPTVQAAAYGAGAVVGGLMDLKAGTGGRGTGVLQQVTVKEAGSQKAELLILIFRDQPAGTFADKVVPTITAADWDKVAAVVHVAAADYTSVQAGFQIAQKMVGFVVSANNADVQSRGLWALPLCVGTPTWGSTSALEFSFGTLQD